MTAPVDVLAVMDELIGIPAVECQDDQLFVDRAKAARSAFAELIAAHRECRARMMHDDRRQEVVCINPAEWKRITDALARVGGVK